MPGIRRLSAVATVGVLAVVTFGIWSGVRPAAAWAGSAPTIGPVQISALGRPGLCWEAGGNGSAVTLEHCDAAVQGQQWSLTGNGVVMNGNGYCLEAQGQPAGQALYIDFAGQCAGAGQGLSGQVWRYQAGQLASTGTGACAAAAGPLWRGTEIVRRACPRGAPRWSIGYSSVTLAPSAGAGAAGSGAGAAESGAADSGTAAGMFSASVTVANAASAQTAYGVTVTLSLPPNPAAGPRITGLHAAGPRVTGGGAGWSCDVRSLTCTGTLPSGAFSRIAIAGRLPAGSRPGDSYTVRARASVTETSQRPGTTRTTTSLTVAVHAAAPGTPGASTAPAARSPLPLTAIIAAALLLGGAILLVVTRRTRPPARHSLPR